MDLKNQGQGGTTATKLPLNGSLLDHIAPIHGLKVRKAYTICKQREKWTDEEHDKFLDALKLYGRAWRRIQEFIGTKTAVQIRSHAQKFFSKVVQGGNDNTESHVAAIEIPPPRPKRKPTHPYPRKYADPRNVVGSTLTQPEKRICSNIVTADLEYQSPKSVLSASMTHTLEFPVSDMPDSCLSNSSCSSGTQSGNLFSVDREDISKAINGSTSSTIANLPEATIMLFGQIVSTKDSKRLSNDGNDTFIPSEQHLDVNVDNKIQKLEESQTSNGVEVQSSNELYYGNWPWAWHVMNSDSACASMQWMPIPLYTGLPPPYLISYSQNTASPSKEERTLGKEPCSSSRMTNDFTDKTNNEVYESTPKRILKSGFVPYKRCSATGSTDSAKTVAEEDVQRVQLCL